MTTPTLYIDPYKTEYEIKSIDITTKKKAPNIFTIKIDDIPITRDGANRIFSKVEVKHYLNFSIYPLIRDKATFILEVKHYFNDVIDRRSAVSGNIAAAIYYHHFGHTIFIILDEDAKYIHVDDNRNPLFQDKKTFNSITFDDLKTLLDRNTFPWPNEANNIKNIRNFYDEKYKGTDIPEVYNEIIL
jgi:hypothetical protein